MVINGVTPSIISVVVVLWYGRVALIITVVVFVVPPGIIDFAPGAGVAIVCSVAQSVIVLCAASFAVLLAAGLATTLFPNSFRSWSSLLLSSGVHTFLASSFASPALPPVALSLASAAP